MHVQSYSFHLGLLPEVSSVISWSSMKLCPYDTVHSRGPRLSSLLYFGNVMPYMIKLNLCVICRIHFHVKVTYSLYTTNVFKRILPFGSLAH